MTTKQSFFFLVMVLWAVAANGQDFYGLAPEAAAVGETIILTGRSLPPGAEILLGEERIRPRMVTPERIEFTVPDLPEGQYVLAVIEDSRRATTPFILRIIEPLPRVLSIQPAQLDECTGPGDREVVLEGRDFLPEAVLLLDGAAVPIKAASRTDLIFSPPSLQPGRHELQVVNPKGRASLPQSLMINGSPEILDVNQGADRVNSYELVITGKNFRFTSALAVDGRRIAVSPGLPPQSDRLEYVDCRTLIYHRFPYSRELKRVSLQVINPGGLESSVSFVTIP